MSEEVKEEVPANKVQIPESIGKMINVLNTVNNSIKDADKEIKSEEFKSMNPVQRSLLIATASAMNALSNILGLRINHEIGMIRKNHPAPAAEKTDTPAEGAK